MVDVVVIGSGPYGLSTAAHLRVKQIPFRIFGKPMSLWRDHMPAGMLLKTDGFATNLAAPRNAFPLKRFYRESGRRDYTDLGLRIPLNTVIDYGLEFQRRHVGGVEETQVADLKPVAGGFNVTLDTREQLFTPTVIVATGPMAYRVVPAELDRLSPAVMSHSSMKPDLRRLKDRKVVVVGGGQSALETAALLREQGTDVTVLARRPLYWHNPDSEDRPRSSRSLSDRIHRPNFGLGPGWKTYFLSEAPAAYHYLPAKLRLARAYSTFGPAGSGWLKSRVDGLVPVVVGRITAAHERAGQAVLSVTGPDGATTLAADYVISATGYKTDLARAGFLKHFVQDIRKIGQAPELNRRFESTVPGLHFIGYASAPSFGPSMRFIYGARFAASRVTQAMTALGSRTRRTVGTTQQQRT